MARQIIVSILGDASKFNAATKQATTSAGKFGNVLQGIGQGIGITAFTNVANVASMAASAVVDFASDSIVAASDLREALALADQVFGDSADEITAWGDTAAKTMGSSQREAVNMAALFGTQFKAIGLDMDEVSDKSIELSELAGDLGSAFNTSSEEAATALRSGLLGEAEPMRKFGVNLSDAKVKAWLLAKGVKAVGGQFTDAQKTLARYNLILEETADSQGMFGRDSESLADKQKELDASMENLSATVGALLLPYMTKFVDYLNTEVVPALSDAAEWVDENQFVLDGLANAFDMLTKGPLGGFESVITRTQERIESETEAVRLAKIPHDDFSEAMRWAGQSADRLGPPVDDAAGSVDDLGDQAGDTADEVDDLSDKLTTMARRALEAIYGPEQLRLELQLDERELRGVNKEIRELEGKKYLTPEQKTALIEGRLRASELREGIDNNTIALGLMNGASLKDIRAAIAAMKKNGIDPSNAAMKELLRRLDEASYKAYQLQRTAAQINVGKGPQRAAGGPASGLTWVGERGPELVSLPKGSYVHTNTESMRMANSTSGSPAKASGFTVVVNGDVYGDGIDQLADKLALRLRLMGA